MVDKVLKNYIFVKRYLKQKNSDQYFYDTDENRYYLLYLIGTIILWFRAWKLLEIKFNNEIYCKLICIIIYYDNSTYTVVHDT